MFNLVVSYNVSAEGVRSEYLLDYLVCSDIHKLYDPVTDTDIMILTSAGSKIDQPKHYDEKNTYISYYDDISREQKSNQQQMHRNKATKRILVVDDEYDVSLVIRLVLEESGFKVDSFTDASEALDNFTTGLYDLVMILKYRR